MEERKRWRREKKMKGREGGRLRVWDAGSQATPESLQVLSPSQMS